MASGSTIEKSGDSRDNKFKRLSNTGGGGGGCEADDLQVLNTFNFSKNL